MKLQKTTWILLVFALLLGGAVISYEKLIAPQRQATQAQKKQIFNFEEEAIQSLTITSDTPTLKFTRNQHQTYTWQMREPKNVPGNDAVVAFLLNLLVEGASDNKLTISADERSEYGLDKPLATIELELDDETTHQLVLGKSDFSGKFLYAIADPSSDTDTDIKVILVPIDFQYAVDRDLDEWKQEAVTKQKFEEKEEVIPVDEPQE